MLNAEFEFNYVEGFLFSRDRRTVTLIHKLTGPPNVINKWNGVGGRIEPGETPAAAMAREFHEEAGVWIGEHVWRPYLVLTAPTWKCHFFEYASDWFANVRTMTKETVSNFDVDKLPVMVENLSWAIPLALDPTITDIVQVRVIE